MKPKLKELLLESSSDQLLDVIEALCGKDKSLENEIEFLLNPKKIKHPQSYYNKFVKKSIDTNSWSKFPNKGITGLKICLEKIKLFESFGNIDESKKMKIAIKGILERCKRKYNSQNVMELKQILAEIQE